MPILHGFHITPWLNRYSVYPHHDRCSYCRYGYGVEFSDLWVICAKPYTLLSTIEHTTFLRVLALATLCLRSLMEKSVMDFILAQVVVVMILGKYVSRL